MAQGTLQASFAAAAATPVQKLEAAIATNNITEIKKAVDKLTVAQIENLPASVAGAAIWAMAEDISRAPREKAADIAEVMKKIGPQADSLSLGQALLAAVPLGGEADVRTIKAIVDNMTADQVQGLDPGRVGMVITGMVQSADPFRQEKNGAEIADVMQKIGRVASAETLTQALREAAPPGGLANVPAIKAIVNNMTADQVRKIDVDAAGHVIADMVRSANPDKQEQNAADIAEVMKKIGSAASAGSLAQALREATPPEGVVDIPAIKAIVNNMTPDQVRKLGSEDAGSVIASMVRGANPDQLEQTGADIAEVMRKIGRAANTDDLMKALLEATSPAGEANIPAVKAIVANMTADHVRKLNSDDAGYIIAGMARHADPNKLEQNGADIAEIMQKIGHTASAASLGRALLEVSMPGGELHVPAMKAIVSNLTADQARTLDPVAAGAVIAEMARSADPNRQEQSAADIAAVMKKIGPRMDPAALDNALFDAQLRDNTAVIKAIMDNVTPEQSSKMEFKPVSVSESKFGAAATTAPDPDKKLPEADKGPLVSPKRATAVMKP